MESPNELGRRLIIIMREIQSTANWAKMLGITKSAISQWESKGRRPKAEHLRFVRDIIRQEDESGATLKKFNELCAEDLFKITHKYKSYKADNLYEYIANKQIDGAMRDMMNIEIPSEEREEFYKEIRLFIVFYSELRFTVRVKMCKLVRKLKSLFDYANPAKFDDKVAEKLDTLLHVFAFAHNSNRLAVSKSSPQAVVVGVGKFAKSIWNMPNNAMQLRGIAAAPAVVRAKKYGRKRIKFQGGGQYGEVVLIKPNSVPKKSRNQITTPASGLDI